MTAEVEIPTITSPVKKALPSPVKKVVKPKQRSGPSKAMLAKPKKRPSNHPKVYDMVVAAIKALKVRKGASLQAIRKYIQANYNDINMVKLQWHVNKALKKGLADDILVRSAGVGVNGRFKIAKPNKKGGKENKKPGVKKTVEPTGDKKPRKTVAEKETKAEKKTVEGAGDAKAKAAPKKSAKKSKAKKAVARKPVAKKPVAKKGKK